jgi:hypothetical protein
MKKTVLATIILAAAVAVAGCGKDAEETEAVVETPAPVVETQAPAQTEEPLAPIIAGDTQAAAAAFPTGAPLNQDNYSEFAEPVMYEVIEDCITWSGNDLQTSGGDLVQGSLVSGVATDGTYLILDDQRVVELSHGSVFE